MIKKWKMTLSLFCFLTVLPSFSAPNVGDAAPNFQTRTHRQTTFDMSLRKGQWTVLYFYPKASTPGCTKQACAFRDNLKKIRDQGAEVFGISADTVESQAAFHKEHNLNFELLADGDAKIIKLFGSQMEGRDLSNRWTYIIDPQLKIRHIDKDVDPVMDAVKVSQKLKELKAKN